MIYDLVSTEINAIRAEKGLSALHLDRSTELQALGFDSLMYTILVTRIEEQVGAGAFERAEEDFTFPVTIGDFVDLFAPAKSDPR